MIKVFIKYDFIHSNTHKLALVMSSLTIVSKKQQFECVCLYFLKAKGGKGWALRELNTSKVQRLATFLARIHRFFALHFVVTTN